MFITHFLFLSLVTTVLSSEITASLMPSRKSNEIILNRQQRWLIGFGELITHYTRRNPLDYNNYGCWCGIGNRGTNFVDGIDACCRTHDSCFQNIPYLMINWICRDAPGSAAYEACMCDATAAQCFARNPYNSGWKNKCQ